ncbi:hyperosmotically inducible periplasmic protein [Candidatus Regiella insecticola LSR1]|uniref:Osmotically-inducible protein Y n=2 Tax=Candidatus Regiella insecticola TaxID=138073 RepID=E0WT57_9ENTR|nr:hyperosmotically inducible periplasmic protein [Candidatus Regiella insecticola LSR1]
MNGEFMKLLKILAVLCVTTILTFTIASCAPTYKSEGTGGYIDDTVITTKVKSALFGTKNFKSTEIKVETFKGRVQLSGFVTSKQAINQAIEVTRRVPGVRSVSNKMQIK